MAKDQKVFLRAPFNYDVDAASKEVELVCDPEESVTQQQFKDECDINEIVRRFGLTGEMPDDFRAPVSGDFTGVSDFQSAMQAVRAAQEAFNSLPAEVRAEFSNDPQRMMDFLSNEKNRERALELGLVQKPPEKTRDVVQAVDELAKVLTAPKAP